MTQESERFSINLDVYRVAHHCSLCRLAFFFFFFLLRPPAIDCRKFRASTARSARRTRWFSLLFYRTISERATRALGCFGKTMIASVYVLPRRDVDRSRASTISKQLAAHENNIVWIARSSRRRSAPDIEFVYLYNAHPTLPSPSSPPRGRRPPPTTTPLNFSSVRNQGRARSLI